MGKKRARYADSSGEEDNDEELERYEGRWLKATRAKNAEPNNIQDSTESNSSSLSAEEKLIRRKAKKQRQKARKLLERKEEEANTPQPKPPTKPQKEKEKEKTPKPKKPPPHEQLHTLRKNVTYYDLIVGRGQPVVDRKRVTVSYTLRAVDMKGKIIDSATSHSFKLGKGDAIEGWDIGVAGMKVGGTRILFVPKEVGYKDRDVGAGRGGVLCFSITVISTGASK